MSNLEVIQNCEICETNSMDTQKRILRHIFKLCAKCNHAMSELKAESNPAKWDEPWFDIHYVYPTKVIKK